MTAIKLKKRTEGERLAYLQGFNAAVEFAALEAENYPRTSSVGKPLSGIAIAAIIRNLKQ